MSNFSLFVGDPLYRILKSLRLTNSRGLLKIFPTIIFFILITWIPTAALALIQGIAITPDIKKSFLYDYAAYAQFFFAIPFFIVGESYIEREIKYGIDHFVDSEIVDGDSLRTLQNVLAKATKVQRMLLPAVIMYLLAHITIWPWLFGELHNNNYTWHTFTTASNHEYFSLAGWWNGIVSVPIVVYWHIRWIWKLGIWYWIIWKISHLKLKIHASHPDQFGGLGFFSRLQSRFGILILAVGGIIAATLSYKLTIEHANFIQIPVAGIIVLYVLLAPCIFIAPLLFFNSQLAKAKRDDLLRYSHLATHHTNKVELLINESMKAGSNISLNEIREAIENLSNIKIFFENAGKMHTLPFDFQYTRRLFASALGPMIPVIIQSSVFSPDINRIVDQVYQLISGS
jgi:hypothetical protein